MKAERPAGWTIIEQDLIALIADRVWGLDQLSGFVDQACADGTIFALPSEERTKRLDAILNEAGLPDLRYKGKAT
jgi:hypothetical protein